MSENKRRRGRPCQEVCREERIHIRMTEAESNHISELSRKAGKNKSDLIRDALKLYEYAMDLNEKKGD